MAKTWKKWMDTAVRSMAWAVGISDVITMKDNVIWKLRIANALIQAPQGSISNTEESFADFLSERGIGFASAMGRFITGPITMKDWYATVSMLFGMQYQLGDINALEPAIIFYQRAMGLDYPDLPRCDTTRFSNCLKDPRIRDWINNYVQKVSESYDLEVKDQISNEELKQMMDRMMDSLQDNLSSYVKSYTGFSRFTDTAENVGLIVAVGFVVFQAYSILTSD